LVCHFFKVSTDDDKKLSIALHYSHEVKKNLNFKNQFHVLFIVYDQ
jgi:hypothetical protein